MIAIVDSERKSLKNLEKILKKALPSYQFKGFTSLEKCIRFVEEGDTDIVFLDLDSITPPYYAEKIVDSFRDIVCDIDIVLLTKKIPTCTWVMKFTDLSQIDLYI